MVVKANDIEGVIYILNVTIMSLKNLSSYGKILVENSVPMSAAITTLTFDDDADFPKLIFSFAGCLKEKIGVIALARSGKKEWESFSPEAISHDPSSTKRISKDEEEEEEEEEEEIVEKKKTKKKKDKPLKGEIVDDDDDDDDASPMSDVDDLLDGWEDDD